MNFFLPFDFNFIDISFGFILSFMHFNATAAAAAATNIRATATWNQIEPEPTTELLSRYKIHSASIPWSTVGLHQMKEKPDNFD